MRANKQTNGIQTELRANYFRRQILQAGDYKAIPSECKGRQVIPRLDDNVGGQRWQAAAVWGGSTTEGREDGGGRVVGWGGALTQRVRRGRSVPHPGLDAASSGKAFSPDPGSPSLARPPAGPAQKRGWPETAGRVKGDKTNMAHQNQMSLKAHLRKREITRVWGLMWHWCRAKRLTSMEGDLGLSGCFLGDRCVWE